MAMLDRYRLFEAHDVDHAREWVAAKLSPHVLDPKRGQRDFEVRLNWASLPRTALLHLTYDVDCRIVPAFLKSYYLVQFVTAGHADVTVGERQYRMHPMCATVTSPSNYFALDWGAGCSFLSFKVHRDFLTGRLRRLALADPTEELVLEPVLDLRKPAPASLRANLFALARQLSSEQDLPVHAAQHLEAQLVDLLLMHQPHNLSPMLDAGTGACTPHQVRVARDCILAHLRDPEFNVSDIVSMTGVPARTLYRSFRTRLGCTPGQFLRTSRLDAIRAELVQGDDTVTAVAMRWGVTHLPRFAAEYRARFGEYPSQTRRLGRCAPAVRTREFN